MPPAPSPVFSDSTKCRNHWCLQHSVLQQGDHISLWGLEDFCADEDSHLQLASNLRTIVIKSRLLRERAAILVADRFFYQCPNLGKIKARLGILSSSDVQREIAAVINAILEVSRIIMAGEKYFRECMD